MYGIPCNLKAKTLNCNSFGICTKTDCKCFLIALHSFLIMFDNVLLCIPYKSLMFCNSLPLPNLCNDVATLFGIDTVSLKQLSSFFRYGPNLLHKNLKALYFSQVCFLNSLPPSTTPTTSSLQF